MGELAVAADLQGKSILIVDDDYDMVNVLRTALSGTGATLETAMDGNAALKAVTEFDPDLIVLDAMLPKRSGFLVLEKLKGASKKRGQRPLVIMITANTGKRHQTWAESLGVDDYLTKPFRMERLTQSVEKLLAD
ncbi:MAG: response regulator [Planctomycetes bacterium]|nr:response regulator [Planctomycetota bacterium]